MEDSAGYDIGGADCMMVNLQIFTPINFEYDELDPNLGHSMKQEPGIQEPE